MNRDDSVFDPNNPGYITWVGLSLRLRMNAVLLFLLNVIVRNDIHKLENCFIYLRNHTFSANCKCDYDRIRALLKWANSNSASLIAFSVQTVRPIKSAANLWFGFEFPSKLFYQEFNENLFENLRGAITPTSR